jgi:flagellar basal body-associated protein FliL
MVTQMAAKSSGLITMIMIAAALLLLAIVIVIILVLIRRRRSTEKQPPVSIPDDRACQEWAPEELNSVELYGSDECPTQERTMGGFAMESMGDDEMFYE